MAQRSKTCAVCAEVFVFDSIRGRGPSWCSFECAGREVRSCKDCGATGPRRELFHVSSSKRFKWHSRCKSCQTVHLRSKYAHLRTSEKRRAYAVAAATRRPQIECQECGGEFRSDRPEAKFCSLSCSGKAASVIRIQAVRSRTGKSVAIVPVAGPWPVRFRDLPTSHPAVLAYREPYTFVSGPCAYCEESFTVAHQTTARYCSKRCQKHERERKKGRFRVPKRLRYAIYERDAWKCQLCGKRVNPDLPWGHPMSASLDHIVPQDHMGGHEPSNLKLAHLRCNGTKQNKVWGDGEQLMLLSEVA